MSLNDTLYEMNGLMPEGEPWHLLCSAWDKIIAANETPFYRPHGGRMVLLGREVVLHSDPPLPFWMQVRDAIREIERHSGKHIL